MRTIQMRRLASRVAVMILVCGAPCAAFAQAEKSGAVAVVNGRPIPQSAMERALRQQAAMGRHDTEEQRKRIREDLVAQELLFQEAERRKLDKSPQFATAMENARRSAMAAVLLQSVKARPVSDQEVRVAYDKTVAALMPNDYRLRVIMVKDEAGIRQIRSSLAKGSAFEELAAKNSLLPSARRGGYIGWVNVNKEGMEAGGPLPAPVATEVRKLSKGGFTPPVSDGQGRWWLVKMEDIRPTAVQPFDRASATIRKALQAAATRKAVLDFLTQLRTSAKIS